MNLFLLFVFERLVDDSRLDLLILFTTIIRLIKQVRLVNYFCRLFYVITSDHFLFLFLYDLSVYVVDLIKLFRINVIPQVVLGTYRLLNTDIMLLELIRSNDSAFTSGDTLLIFDLNGLVSRCNSTSKLLTFHQRIIRHFLAVVRFHHSVYATKTSKLRLNTVLDVIT